MMSTKSGKNNNILTGSAPDEVIVVTQNGVANC